MRYFYLAYGLIAYFIFFGTILYAIGFISGFAVPKNIDDGTPGETGTSVLVNVALLGLFAIQHTIMARPAFKRWWTRIVPQPIERSTFVLFASLILILAFWQWRPIPTVVWNTTQPLASILLGLSLAGWVLVFYATFVIDHFDLFGLRQVYFGFIGAEYQPPKFVERTIYRWVRHPLMLGFLIAMWFAPSMTYGHVLFSAVTTAYIFVGIQLEERDLRAALGEAYEDYRQRTPMIIPGLRFGGRSS